MCGRRCRKTRGFFCCCLLSVLPAMRLLGMSLKPKKTQSLDSMLEVEGLIQQMR